MLKNLNIIFCVMVVTFFMQPFNLFGSFNPFRSVNPFEDTQEGASMIVEQLVNKAIDTASNRIARADSKYLEKSAESVGKSALRVSEKLLHSKEADKFSGAVGTATSKMVKESMVGAFGGIEKGSNESVHILNRTMKNSSKELGKGVDESLGNIGQQMKETFRRGGDLDIGMNEAGALATRNVNTVIQKIWHNNMMKSGAIVIGVVSAFFVSAYGIPLGFKMLERALMRPKLIISSSKKTIWEKLFGVKALINVPMIFAPTLENRLNEIVDVTSVIYHKIKTGASNVKYRNLMLYGPPGTGKTLFATELAKRCGLEYAFMSGSSFSKFKNGEGIEALDELFAWANKSSGLLIFIDEAESFLLKRENMDPQSPAYLLLNNFLNYTGTKSNKFMIVFATNHKNALDSAMYRRIDDLIEITLPGKAERVRLLTLYIENILMDVQQNEEVFIRSVKKVLTMEVIENIAIQTKGLSGSDLEGIINNLKTSADILNPSIVTVSLINTVVEQAITKYFTFSNGAFLGTVED